MQHFDLLQVYFNFVSWYSVYYLQVALANPRWRVISKIKMSNFIDKLGRGAVFLTVEDAVDANLDSKLHGLNSC